MDKSDQRPETRQGWEPPAFVSYHTHEPPTPERNSKAVLVVDDKEAVRTSVAAVLRSAGYTVIESADGHDALPLLQSETFDAMVLDLRMPLLCGASLLSALSAPPPTVILSATELEQEARTRIGKSVVAQLTKPVAPQRLIDAVASAVDSGIHRA